MSWPAVPEQLLAGPRGRPLPTDEIATVLEPVACAVTAAPGGQPVRWVEREGEPLGRAAAE
jgi:hypothetical protein